MTWEMVVDYDPAVWVLLGAGDEDVEDWSVAEAERLIAETGIEGDAADITRLSTLLLAACKGIAHLPGFILLHLPNPFGPTGPLARITALDPSDGSLEELRVLAGAEEEGLIEPAVVDWFETPIGTALRCRLYPSEPGSGRRFLRRPATASMGVSYVWHLPALDADVRLACVSSDTDALTAILDDVDGLARSIRLEDVPE